MNRKAVIVFVIALISLSAALAIVVTHDDGKYDFRYWTEGSESLACLVSFVDDVTDSKSDSFVPTEDRIAVFDMDGTLVCETANTYMEYMIFAYRVLDDETFAASDSLRDTALKIREMAALGKGIPEDLEDQLYESIPKAFEGMTNQEYTDYILEYLNKPAIGFDNLLYCDAYFKPMKEIVEYLAQKGFTIYICSGTERVMVRTLVSAMFNVPSDHIIGADIVYCVEGQEDGNAGTITMTSDDVIVRGPTTVFKNYRAEKVISIEKEIGKKPILAFGNSSSDYSMLEYVASNNEYMSQAFFVLADDDVRERPNLDKTAGQKAYIESKGWIGISMKDDFHNIYGTDVMPSNVESCE